MTAICQLNEFNYRSHYWTLASVEALVESEAKVQTESMSSSLTRLPLACWLSWAVAFVEVSIRSPRLPSL
jgi:hypothetical protein